MSLHKVKSEALRLLTNLRGWKTERKLLVIESDDWGAIRMPSRRAWQNLLDAGIRVDRSRYDSLDCLESRDDFQCLMNVLDSHRDRSGRAAIFTMNAVMGNPDFEAIERDHFEVFHHEHFFDSCIRYHGQNPKEDWEQAAQNDLIRPQFHAREHLNSVLWLSDLRSGNKETRLAFEHGFYGLSTKTSSPRQKHYKAAYSAESSEELETIAEITSNGLTLFRETFGFPSETFVACNYVLPAELEQTLSSEGISWIQTQRGYLQPMPHRGGERRIRYPRTGERNEFGQFYGVRNVLFEPYLDEKIDWPKVALRAVSQAFRVGTPAIVCSHRINYTSGMNQEHRDNSLRQLDGFLGLVTHRWPDVEFITSDELASSVAADLHGPQ